MNVYRPSASSGTGPPNEFTKSQNFQNSNRFKPKTQQKSWRYRAQTQIFVAPPTQKKLTSYQHSGK